jgi:hypothetical protein
VHSLGSMLTQPTPELRRVPGCFRLHESFVKGPCQRLGRVRPR